MRRGATGLIAWFTQRVSAIYIAIFSLYLLYVFIACPPENYQQWHTFVTQPMISVSSVLFFAALMIHAWIGVRDVVIDYVHPFAIRLTILSMVMIGLMTCGLWALQILTVTYLK